MPFTAAQLTGHCRTCETEIRIGDMIGVDAYGVTCEDCYIEKES